MRVLCNRLKSLEYIDLAEKLLAVLCRLCEQQPLQALFQGAVGALLPLLDFFPSDVQRRAARAAAKALSAAASAVPFQTSQKTANPLSTGSPQPLLASSPREASVRSLPGSVSAEASPLPDAREDAGGTRRFGEETLGGGSARRSFEEGGVAPPSSEASGREGRFLDELQRQQRALEAQTAEFAALLAPALPVLTTLLSSGDEVVVQVRSFASALRCVALSVWRIEKERRRLVCCESTRLLRRPPARAGGVQSSCSLRCTRRRRGQLRPRAF